MRKIKFIYQAIVNWVSKLTLRFWPLMKRVLKCAKEACIPVLLLTIFSTILFIILRIYVPNQVPEYLLLISSTILCLISLVNCFAFASEKSRASELSHEIELLTANEREHLKHIQNLKRDTDLLTSMRDVSRIVNDDVDFEEILEQVFPIIVNLVQPEKIALFLINEESGKPFLKVCHIDGNIHFNQGGQHEYIDDTGIIEALEHQVINRIARGKELALIFPLSAGQENLGVLKLILPLEGEANEQAEKIAQCERLMAPFLKHISLSIKTPTLYDRAVTDFLTGLYTKRHFRNQITSYFQIAKRHGTLFSLIMIDIDHFKNINDRYGHVSGDLILRGVAMAILKSIRTSDSSFRYGGEELAVILPETDMEDARNLGERIRKDIEDTCFQGQDGGKIRLTVSIGIAKYEPDIPTPQDMISRADQALYHAKQSGRNRVCLWKKEKAAR